MVASTLLINEWVPIPVLHKEKKKKQKTVYILKVTEIKI